MLYCDFFSRCICIYNQRSNTKKQSRIHHRRGSRVLLLLLLYIQMYILISLYKKKYIPKYIYIYTRCINNNVMRVHYFAIAVPSQSHAVSGTNFWDNLVFTILFVIENNYPLCNRYYDGPGGSFTTKTALTSQSYIYIYIYTVYTYQNIIYIFGRCTGLYNDTGLLTRC